jgi:hypothetical protein
LHEVRSPQSFDLVWGKVPLPSFVSAGATVHAYIGNGHAVLCFPSYDGRLEFGWAIEKGSFGDLRKRGIDEWIDQMAAFVSSDLAAHLHASRRRDPSVRARRDLRSANEVECAPPVTAGGRMSPDVAAGRPGHQHRGS